MNVFAKGAVWKHRGLELVVNITNVLESGYTLGWANASDADGLSAYLIRGIFTAEDLVRDFSPVLVTDKWDQLLDDDLMPGN